MAEQQGERRVSRQEFSVAYAGTARLDDHTIDVEALAPALLAYGRLIRAVNQDMNGSKSAAQVRVVSDFEHRCFNIHFDAIVSVYQQVQNLLGITEIKTAKEILEWIGLVKPTKLIGLSLLQYLRWRRGRAVQETTDLVDTEGRQQTTVTVTGDGSAVVGDGNSVTIDRRVYVISNDPKTLRAVRDTLDPIGQDGVDRMELRERDEDVPEIIGLEQTEQIIASCNKLLEEAGEEKEQVEVTTAWIVPHAVTFDPKATGWRFRLGREVVPIDISETRIAQDAVARGAVMVEDSYQVKLQVTTPIPKKGKPGKSSYKVLEVIKFIPGSPHGTQLPLISNPR